MMATGMVLVGVPAGLLVLLRWLMYIHAWSSPEIPRKLVHVAMGLAVLPLPWLPIHPLVVPIAAALTLLVLLLLRWLPGLRATFGRALYGIRRPSFGEVCFPLAVALVYLLARDEPHAYVIPLLLLTLADPAAALVGTRLGRVTTTGSKTPAGSLAFFGVALVCSVGGLVLTGLMIGSALMGGVLLAALSTEIERQSRLGLDNLFVPVGSCIVLLIIT